MEGVGGWLYNLIGDLQSVFIKNASPVHWCTFYSVTIMNSINKLQNKKIIGYHHAWPT